MAGGATTIRHSPATGRLQHGETAAWNRWRRHPGGQFSGKWIVQGCAGSSARPPKVSKTRGMKSHKLKVACPDPQLRQIHRHVGVSGFSGLDWTGQDWNGLDCIRGQVGCTNIILDNRDFSQPCGACLSLLTPIELRVWTKFLMTLR